MERRQNGRGVIALRSVRESPLRRKAAGAGADARGFSGRRGGILVACEDEGVSGRAARVEQAMMGPLGDPGLA